MLYGAALMGTKVVCKGEKDVRVNEEFGRLSERVEKELQGREGESSDLQDKVEIYTGHVQDFFS